MEFIQEIMNENENSLIIIVSDHATRNSENHYNIEGYHVPLIVTGKEFDQEKIDIFLSHLDFSDIVKYYIGDKQNINHQDSILTMGTTGFPPIIGNIERNGTYIFVNELSKKSIGNGDISSFYEYRKFYDLNYK